MSAAPSRIRALLPDSVHLENRGGACFLLGVAATPSQTEPPGPVDWVPPWPDQLPHQADLLWIEGPEGARLVLPHVVELGPWGPGAGGEVAVVIQSEHLFRPRESSALAGEYWDRQADAYQMRRPYDPRFGNARLRRCTAFPPVLYFEPVRYTDYVRTNLALDIPLPGGNTLRELESPGGRLCALSQSELAGSVGTGVLLFTSDGALIVQRRSPGRVLFRAGEICPGGSGTLDWEDIQRCRSGRLIDLDVYREAFEEVGVSPRLEQLLGVTRELIRLDPGIWMAADVEESARTIEQESARRREDDEGELLTIPLGRIGRALPNPAPTQEEFWSLMASVARLGPPSVSLLANLALWWISADPRRGGISSLESLVHGTPASLLRA